MPVRFADDQVVKATGGVRLKGGARSAYGAVCTDTRHLVPGCLFVALTGARFDGHDFLDAAAAGGAAGVIVRQGRGETVRAPGLAVFEVEDPLAALGALARFHRARFSIPVGAVTGSNGKTSTKEMVAAILETRGAALKTQGNFNNEIGVPLTLFELGPAHVAAVIEMGMNHAGEIDRIARMARPTAGLITTVQPAHLETLGSLEAIARAKGELFRALEPTMTAVVNIDEPLIVAQAESAGARTLTFGVDPSAEVRLVRAEPLGLSGQRIELLHQGRRHELTFRLLGAHQAHNAAGAFALALALGYTPDEAIAGLASASASERRQSVRRAAGGFEVLDDCYNANPGSMKAALATLQGLASGRRAFVVLGDMLELGETSEAAHRALGEHAAQVAVGAAFFGERARESHRAAESAGLGGRAAHFLDPAALVEWLRPQLGSQDLVLVKGSRGMRLERVVEALVGAEVPGGQG